MGGVCWQWAKYYIERSEQLGFMGKRIDFYPENTSASGHSIALLWDKKFTQYCIVDQTKIIGCRNLGVSS